MSKRIVMGLAALAVCLGVSGWANAAPAGGGPVGCGLPPNTWVQMTGKLERKKLCRCPCPGQFFLQVDGKTYKLEIGRDLAEKAVDFHGDEVVVSGDLNQDTISVSEVKLRNPFRGIALAK
jgi:hypothetical protein